MSIYLFINSHFQTYVICMCCRVCITNTHPTIHKFAQYREQKMYVILPVHYLVLKKRKEGTGVKYLLMKKLNNCNK